MLAIIYNKDFKKRLEVKKDNNKIDQKMLEMLVCPLTKTRLIISKDKKELISPAARLAFPIKNSIPLLCLDESRTISDQEYDALK